MNKELANVKDEDQRLEYTNLIQTKENSLKKSQYDLKKQNVTIEPVSYTHLAFRILRSLMRIVKPWKSSFPTRVEVAWMSSISARIVGSPRISISHCMN